MSVKITEAVKARAVEIALSGESPLPYLKQAGAANPSACWQYIKKQLEKRDPEKYAALPAKLPKTGAKDVPAPIGGGDWEKADVPEPVATVKVDGPLRIETPEKIVDLPDGKMMQIPELPKPMEYRITGISTTAGDFQYFRKQGFLDWTDLSGETVSMSLAEWAELMRVWPEVLKVLGVEL